MSFLEGLAAFGEGAVEGYSAVTTAQANQALKQQQMQLREAQLALLMDKTAQGQQKAQATNDANVMATGLEGAAGTPSDPSADPSAALPFASPAPAGGPSGGPTGAAGLPLFAAPPASGGAAAPAAGRSMSMRPAPGPMPGSGQPIMGQFPASQPPGAAGAGMPAPSPQAGQPAAQLGGMPQGQPTPPAGQPQMPPGPGGAPSFDQRFQGQPQPQPIQARPVQTQRMPGRQPSLGAGPQQAPLPDQTFQPQQPKGKRLFDLATPEQQAQAGITQPQQKGTQVAQAGEPGVWKPGQRPNPSTGMSWLRQKYPGRSEADYAKAYKQALPNMMATEKYEALQEQRAATRQHQKFEEGLQTEKAERTKQEKTEHKSTIKSVAEGLMDGTIPPDKIGWKDRDEVQAYVHDHGGNLSQLNLQWKHAQSMIKLTDSNTQARYIRLANQVDKTINEVVDLAKQVNLSNYPTYNAWVNDYYKKLDPTSPRGRAATRYQTAVTNLKEELGQLATGGYAPTESAWEQARQLINEDWAPQRMEDSLRETQKIVNFRLNAILGASPVESGQAGFGPYGRGGQQQAPQQEQAPQQRQPSTPQPGEIRRFKDGGTRRLKGGNPDDPNNWEPVT